MTLPIAHRFADKVAEHRETRRQTIAEGRNRGAQLAAGDYFVFMDADVFIPNMDAFFTRALRQFAKNPQLVALTAWRRVLPDHETLADKLNLGVLSIGIWIMNNLLRMPNSYGEFQMIPAPAFRKVGGYDERLIAAEDMDMFIRLGKLGKTRLCPQLTFYDTGRRVHKLGWIRAWNLWLGTGIRARYFSEMRMSPWEEIR